MKYVAFKLENFNYWIWFKVENVTETDAFITGKNGWGKGGALTEMHVSTSTIEGRIYSDTLQCTQQFEN